MEAWGCKEQNASDTVCTTQVWQNITSRCMLTKFSHLRWQHVNHAVLGKVHKIKMRHSILLLRKACLQHRWQARHTRSAISKPYAKWPLLSLPLLLVHLFVHFLCKPANLANSVAMNGNEVKEENTTVQRVPPLQALCSINTAKWAYYNRCFKDHHDGAELHHHFSLSSE